MIQLIALAAHIISADPAAVRETFENRSYHRIETPHFIYRTDWDNLVYGLEPSINPGFKYILNQMEKVLPDLVTQKPSKKYEIFIRRSSQIGNLSQGLQAVLDLEVRIPEGGKVLMPGFEVKPAQGGGLLPQLEYAEATFGGMMALISKAISEPNFGNDPAVVGAFGHEIGELLATARQAIAADSPNAKEVQQRLMDLERELVTVQRYFLPPEDSCSSTVSKAGVSLSSFSLNHANVRFVQISSATLRIFNR